jgi:hypothetical protein
MGVARRNDRKLAAEATPPSLYESDMYAWAIEQAARVRALKPAGIDAENVAEELEGLARRERKEIVSRLDVLLLHLLKFRYQPEKRKGGWEASVRVHRFDLREVLSENPSLSDLPRRLLAERYRRARQEATAETGLPLDTFPEVCPFTIKEIMDDRFFG